LTSLDAVRQEDSHRKPSFLPDGRHFLFTSRSAKHENSGVFIASTDSPERIKLLNVETGAEYTSQGLLLFVREGTQGTLMAMPFDADRLRATAAAFPIGDRVPPEISKFSVSNGGVLAYTSAPANRYVWFDRAGTQLSPVTPPGRYGSIALSLDGTRAATRRVLQGNTDLWVIDMARGTTSRLTTNVAAEDDPVWSPDGEHIAFSSTREMTSDLYQVQAAGAGVEEPLLISEKPKGPSDWSPDGRFILFTQHDPATLSDIWALPLFGDRRPFPVLQTEFMEAQAHLSNDGRWMAYESSESGKWEVYLQTFPRSSRKWQVSTDGGAQPIWQRDGREIFYVDSKGTLTAVAVSLSGNVDIGVPRPLFKTSLDYAMSGRYAASRDGQRFLVNVPLVDDDSAKGINLVVNWSADLGKRD
jgi:Tol biopolymer transport system component